MLPAPMVELPSRLIKMFSYAGENILDPFLGSGTTSLAAGKLGRNSFGYEINPDFVPLIEEKLGGSDHEVEIIERNDTKLNLEHEFLKLPYIFKDPVRIDKKVDPKTMLFGSRIN